MYLPTLQQTTGLKPKVSGVISGVISSAWKIPVVPMPTAKIEWPIEANTNSSVTSSAWKIPVVSMPTAEIEWPIEEKKPVQEQTRLAAIETLSNTKQIGDKLVRTRMCNSVGTGNQCRHGSNCRFAHSEEELVDVECFFGSSCHNVVHKGEGVYCAVKGKYCDRKHPGETKASICARTGRQMPKVVAPVVEPVVVPVVAPTQPAWKKPLSLEVEPKILAEPIASTEIVAPVEEIVLRVPKELAMQAMEIAIKSGKTNIRLEFI
jgi:hypothetical protein